jgi:ribosomal protein L11 methyltransferase
MTDIDPVAVDAAAANCRLNGLTARIILGDLLERTDVTADVLVANITADILMRFAPKIRAHMKEGARLILSGILDARLDEVKACYKEAGFRLLRERADGEWRAVVLE